MAEQPKTFGGRWRVLERLGRGGQGVVYKVADEKGLHPYADRLRDLHLAMRAVQFAIHHGDTNVETFNNYVNTLRPLVVPDTDERLAAVKELLPFEDAAAASEKTALARMKAEIETLHGVSHPALLKVFDTHIDQRWFAMQYFPSGPMSKKPKRFRGDVLAALRALRPVVDAVAELHQKKTVHRDIKPDNIFVADDSRLVLGDCGLAFKLENQERLTLTFENVGTRDYQPPWTYAMRIEDVKPNFDVFSLAKVLWSMVSGLPRFPLVSFEKPTFDLRAMFPNNTDVQFLHRVFRKCIVMEEEQCTIDDAAALGAEFDAIIAAIERGGQVPSLKHDMRCRFCGVGVYRLSDGYNATATSNFGQKSKLFLCDRCGHFEMFTFTGDKTPPAWSD